MPTIADDVTVTILGLTKKNIDALRETLTPLEAERVTLEGNTATFLMASDEALALVEGVQLRAAQEHGVRGHPYASLHAVRQKLHAAQDRQPAPGQDKVADLRHTHITTIQRGAARLKAIREAEARTVAELDRNLAAAVQAGLPVPELASAMDWDERTVRKYVERGNQ